MIAGSVAFHFSSQKNCVYNNHDCWFYLLCGSKFDAGCLQKGIFYHLIGPICGSFTCKSMAFFCKSLSPSSPQLSAAYSLACLAAFAFIVLVYLL
jgi:hypothetical protein